MFVDETERGGHLPAATLVARVHRTPDATIGRRHKIESAVPFGRCEV